MKGEINNYFKKDTGR